MAKNLVVLFIGPPSNDRALFLQDYREQGTKIFGYVINGGWDLELDTATKTILAKSGNTIVTRTTYDAPLEIVPVSKDGDYNEVIAAARKKRK